MRRAQFIPYWNGQNDFDETLPGKPEAGKGEEAGQAAGEGGEGGPCRLPLVGSAG